MSIEGCPHGPKVLWPEGGCTFCAQEDAREQAKQEALREQVDAVVAARQLLLRGPVGPSLVNTELRVFVVEGEGLSAEYDVYDEWVVLAHDEAEAFILVRGHGTYTASAEPLVVKETSAGMQPGVAYASFHPG